MTADQVRDLLIVVVCVAAMIGSFVYLSKVQFKTHMSDALAKIDSFVQERSPDIENLRIVTTGHHYIWAEITRDDLIGMIKDDCDVSYLNGHVGISQWKSADFLLGYVEERNCLQVVFTKDKSFDWESLKFHDEYVSAP